MRKRRERACFISEHLCFPRFENINVLEALAKQRCVSIGKQNVYQWFSRNGILFSRFAINQK